MAIYYQIRWWTSEARWKGDTTVNKWHTSHTNLTEEQVSAALLCDQQYFWDTIEIQVVRVEETIIETTRGNNARPYHTRKRRVRCDRLGSNQDERPTTK